MRILIISAYDPCALSAKYRTAWLPVGSVRRQTNREYWFNVYEGVVLFEDYRYSCAVALDAVRFDVSLHSEGTARNYRCQAGPMMDETNAPCYFCSTIVGECGGITWA